MAVQADPPGPAPREDPGPRSAPAPGASAQAASAQAASAQAASAQAASAQGTAAARRLPPHLARWLAAAGITGAEDPVAAWRRLREAEGRRVTVVDLYELVAASRGLAARDLPRDERRRLAESAMSVTMPGFTLIAGTERVGDSLEIVPYDTDWPLQYDRWRRLVGRALGVSALRIEHVGSTSVPGLSAKPVIDIQVSVADVGDEARYLPPLEAAGLQLRSRDDLRRFLRPLPGQPRNVHVHVCAAGGAWEREHVLFRDYLRAHPAARDDYARVKWAAVADWHDDRWAYTEAKTGIILDILDQAERWARATAWSPGPPAPAPPSFP
jgi:GrpB-like predicted nucleotidyltransferase (UPF0157 family)